MIGTLEPRKGHAQVLEAFNHLWKNGFNANLVIVGKRGWLIDDFIDQLESNLQLNKKLFWLESISDQYLREIYNVGDCLIAASYGEGFGLPLIEAAQYGVPIVARDIPVFREVAGENAEYFATNKSVELAEFLECWLGRKRLNRHVTVSNMTWMSWNQSASNLLAKVSHI